MQYGTSLVGLTVSHGRNVSPHNLAYSSLIKQKNFYEKTDPGFCHSCLLKGHVPEAAIGRSLLHLSLNPCI